MQPPTVTSYVCLTCIINTQHTPIFPALQVDTPWHSLQSQATRLRLNVALTRKDCNNASNRVHYSFSTKLHAGKLHGRKKVMGAKLEVFWGLRAALAKL